MWQVYMIQSIMNLMENKSQNKFQGQRFNQFIQSNASVARLFLSVGTLLPKDNIKIRIYGSLTLFGTMINSQCHLQNIKTEKFISQMYKVFENFLMHTMFWNRSQQTSIKDKIVNTSVFVSHSLCHKFFCYFSIQLTC